MIAHVLRKVRRSTYTRPAEALMTYLRVQAMRFVDWVRRIRLRLCGIRLRTIHTSQGRLRMLETKGSGALPPTLLIHGLSASAVDWGPIMLQLRKQCQRVRAIELPGHGTSDTPVDGMGHDAMRAMLFEASSVFMDCSQVLIGNSLGGLTAVRLALRLPEKTSALVLVSPGGTPTTQAELDQILDRFQMDSWDKAAQFTSALLAGHNKKRPDLTWGIRGRANRPSIQELVAQIRIDDLLSAEELSDLQMPILLYWGQDDEILNAQHLDFYRANLPAHTEVLTPAGMGHAPFLDSNRRFLEHIMDFCSRLPHSAQRLG